MIFFPICVPKFWLMRCGLPGIGYDSSRRGRPWWWWLVATNPIKCAGCFVREGVGDRRTGVTLITKPCLGWLIGFFFFRPPAMSGAIYMLQSDLNRMFSRIPQIKSL